MRHLAIAVLSMGLAFGFATMRLYLKDGTYQLMSEYQVQTDRVRYFSVERGAWEEIPLDLVDLKKTQDEVSERETKEREEAKVVDEEEKAEREIRKEYEKVPMEPGAYLVEGDKVRTLPVGEVKVVSNKRRQVLKLMSPIPVVYGKSSVELDGARSKNVTDNARPEFYIRLSDEDRIAIFQLKPGKNIRVVETLNIMPVTNEVFEDPKKVPTFQRQLASGVFKLWPEKPLEPGEYAVVEYQEGKVNLQVWDFAYQPKGQ